LGVWEFGSLGVWTIGVFALLQGFLELELFLGVWEFRSLGVWTIGVFALLQGFLESELIKA
jgi:hypothetical protein